MQTKLYRVADLLENAPMCMQWSECASFPSPGAGQMSAPNPSLYVWLPASFHQAPAIIWSSVTA